MEITLIILIAIAIFWHSTMQAREIGLVITKQLCSDMGTKLLDDAIVLSHLRVKRDDQGRLQIRRIYSFRYLDNQNDIHHGTLILLGKKQESVLLDSK
ncbi:MAG: DUF3301 domain-containing protein [Magnetococcales bacterium]|nr:DUF3301 domain-containing protein [Magnetococcales bacterium]